MITASRPERPPDDEVLELTGTETLCGVVAVETAPDCAFDNPKPGWLAAPLDDSDGDEDAEDDEDEPAEVADPELPPDPAASAAGAPSPAVQPQASDEIRSESASSRRMRRAKI
jgi:hypothetical protein